MRQDAAWIREEKSGRDLDVPRESNQPIRLDKSGTHRGHRWKRQDALRICLDVRVYPGYSRTRPGFVRRRQDAAWIRQIRQDANWIIPDTAYSTSGYVGTHPGHF